MEINVILNNAILYGLPYRVDVKTGESFILALDKVDGEEVYAKNDKILEVDHVGKDINITAKMKGQSKIRIMKEAVIVREVEINVLDTIGPPASSLNVTFGGSEPK